VPVYFSIRVHFMNVMDIEQPLMTTTGFSYVQTIVDKLVTQKLQDISSIQFLVVSPTTQDNKRFFLVEGFRSASFIL